MTSVHGVSIWSTTAEGRGFLLGWPTCLIDCTIQLTGNTRESESRLERGETFDDRSARESVNIEYGIYDFFGMWSEYKYLEIPNVMSYGKLKSPK